MYSNENASQPNFYNGNGNYPFQHADNNPNRLQRRLNARIEQNDQQSRPGTSQLESKWYQKTPMEQLGCQYGLFKSFISIILIIFTGIYCYQYRNTGNILGNIAQNWTKDFISEIRVIHSNEICNNTQENLILFEWPGTQQGCDCTFGSISTINCCFSPSHQPTLAFSQNTRSIKVEHKHINLIQQKVNKMKNKVSYENMKRKHTRGSRCCFGSDIDPKSPRFFTKWTTDSGINPSIFSLCATKIKGYSLKTSFQQSNCDNTEQKCGSQDLGQSDTVFCIPKASKCPITSFSIDNISGNQGYPIVNGWFLNVKREETGRYPLVETKIGEGKGICINPEHYSISNGRSPYTLLLGSHSKCEIDSGFIPVSQIPEFMFFQINQSLDLEKALPEFKLSHTYTYSLFYKNNIPLKSQFRYLINDVEKINKGLGSVYQYTIFLIVMASLLLLIGFSSFLKLSDQDSNTNDCSYYGHRAGIDQQGKSINLFNLAVLSTFLIYGLFFFTMSKIHKVEAPFLEFGNTILSTHCADKQTEKFFESQLDGIKLCQYSFVICICINILIEPTISFWFVQCFRKICPQRRY